MQESVYFLLSTNCGCLRFMAVLKFHFNISLSKSQGTFALSWAPSLECYDNWAVLNVETRSYNVTNCELTNMGDLGSQRDSTKEVFFQLDMDDGRRLVGYSDNRQGFSAFMKQWRLMKRNVKAEARAKASQEGKTQTSTVQTSKALKALKELAEAGIITKDEYEAKRQALVARL